MTAAPAGGAGLADAIARVLAGPFAWRTVMPPQGGPELDAVSVVESTTQAAESAASDTVGQTALNSVEIPCDLPFSRSRENTQAADQAFSATAEEAGNGGRAAHGCWALRDSLSLTEVPEGPEFVGSLRDLTSRSVASGTENTQVDQRAGVSNLGAGAAKGTHPARTPGGYHSGTPSSSVGLPDGTGSVGATDGKGVQGLHPPAAADLRGAARVTVPEASAAVDTLPAGSPVPAGYASALERVHLSALPLSNRPGAVVAQTETAAADDGRTRLGAHAERVPEDIGSSGYTGPEQGERDGLAAAARSRFAGVLAAGGMPSIRTLRAEYGIGQARAQRVQAALRRVPAVV